jgi:hypothetical protein
MGWYEVGSRRWKSMRTGSRSSVSHFVSSILVAKMKLLLGNMRLCGSAARQAKVGSANATPAILN